MKRDCMKKERMGARAWRAMVAGLALAGSVFAGAGLEQGFRAPPRTAKPHTWFHMMNGNVTKEGLTRDFEELARAGIGGVQMFDAGCDIPPGGLDFNSPEWFETFRHAASEARRLGLEICIPNCSGWSSSGGPWNPPSNGMKRVTFRQTSARGPAKFRAKLPRETDDHGFYADIGVFAFPTPPAEKASFARRRPRRRALPRPRDSAAGGGLARPARLRDAAPRRGRDGHPRSAHVGSALHLLMEMPNRALKTYLSRWVFA